MASTPEGEQDIVAAAEPEPEPFSPSVFLDLPPTPPGPDGDDLVLPFISRILMEDDIHDSFFYKYPDHPALLQAQQPFADILSGAATTALPPPEANAVEVELISQSQLELDDANHSQAPQLGKISGDGDQQALFISGHNGEDTDTADMLNLAFLKGMEEANKFLPTNNDLNSHQKRLTSQVQEEMGADETSRSSKLMAPAEPEETDEVLDQVALNVVRLSSCVEDIESLRITDEDDKNTGRRRRKKNTKQQQPAASGDLDTLLLHCAEAVGMDDRRSATELLQQIWKQSSPSGDANQRLAHCLAQGLEARLAGTGSQLYRSLVSRRTSVVEYLRAYQLFAQACCFKTMAFWFSGRTICRATTGKKKLHIVDYGIGYGLQWPTFLYCLAAREGGPPEVRMTGIDLPQPGFRPSSRIDQTGRRLSSCAAQFGVPFTFRGIAARWETIGVEDLGIRPDEVLVVNSLVPFGYLMDAGVAVDSPSPSPRDAVLSTIRRMRPQVFVLGVVNASYSSAFFVTRFREVLSYYAAIFDMLDATTPRENALRVLVERDLYGQCALNVVACEGADRVERPETYRQWQARNRRVGLRQLPLDPPVVEEVRERVKRLYHQDFVVDVDQQWLLQGWKGRILYAMSTWVAND